jgi:hypothetical protein
MHIDPVTLALVSALAALVSAIGALAAASVSIWIARRQIREARINALRDDLCEVFAISTRESVSRSRTLSAEEEFKYKLERRSRAQFLLHRIRLRLDDPEDERSEALLKAINQLFEENSSLIDLDAMLRRAESKSREILRRF